ncbi:MAG TPA: hypothetical protein VKK81_12345 [Candidatus Binatia bacterium]|nr:hypothetical protein [Candidatus Binatia bacterium]
MSTKIDRKPPQLPYVHRSSSAADERTVRRLGARIFADLLPGSTSGLVTVPPALRPGSSLDDAEWSRSDWETRPLDRTASALRTPTSQAGKESFSMRAYRTESRYYFSSKQLLPAGSLVFFSDKIQRYVHPTDGTLLDPHPRLQQLSDVESQELEVHWQKALSRY